MRAFATLAVVAFAVAAIGAAPDRTTLRGYTSASSARERGLESQFIDIPSVAKALDIAMAIEARPHYAGTPGDYALALYMRDAMRAAGVSAQLETFTAQVDSPRRLTLELSAAPDPAAPPKHRHHGPDSTALDLAEAPEASDAATSTHDVGLPFNSGSADGDVESPLVYVSRGLEGDYAALARAGIDVGGAVVLVRYGAQFRGLLAQRAQAHGAAGVLFYSDPADDGESRGLTYPRGPWRPLTAVQRGSVGANIRVPTLPISAANAQLLLAALRGAPGPASWGGGLPVVYPFARGPGRVHLVVHLNRVATRLWNTVGIIPGLSGDQSVILGAHRDAWVFGVGDNGDGVGTMLEVARAFGFLLKSGWQPRRSIVIAGWDGEEIGLTGSTAYVSAHRTELEHGCAAYLNADENITGAHFDADAAAAIAPLVADVTHAVSDPLLPAASVYDRWAAQAPHARPQVKSPGGGSDHEAFLYGAGIPVANIGFDGPFGVYHSSYDTLRYAKLFSDPGFVFHRTAVQLYGLAALRLADADAVPYSFGGYPAVLRMGIKQIRARAAREHLTADVEALRHAVDRLAYATVRIDSQVAQATVDSSREIRVARALDAVTYGADGYTGVTFPDVTAAFAARSSLALNSALGRTVAALDRATAQIAR